MPTPHITSSRTPFLTFPTLAAVVAIVAAPAASAADGAAVARLERIAYERLGPDAVGCAVARDETSPVVLKVTDRAALPAARGIAAGMRFPVTVRLIPRRYGLPGLAPVVRSLNEAAQRRRRVAITRDMGAMRANPCGSVKIWFGVENAGWAIDQQNRFGGDRVTLELVEPGGRMPA